MRKDKDKNHKICRNKQTREKEKKMERNDITKPNNKALNIGIKEGFSKTGHIFILNKLRFIVVQHLKQ